MTDRQECHYLRQLHSIHTGTPYGTSLLCDCTCTYSWLAAIDDNLITESPEGGGDYAFFVHPSETVRLPFKYQSFRELVRPSVPTSGERKAESTVVKVLWEIQRLDNLIRALSPSSSLEKVYLQSSQEDLLAILNVRVEPQLQRVDRVLHFYHPERTFLKKHFVLPTALLHSEAEGTNLPPGLTGLRGISTFSLNPDIWEDSPEVFVCGSEPDSTCEVRTMVCYTVFLLDKSKLSPAPYTYCTFNGGTFLVC